VSTGATIVDMTPMKRVTLYYWQCQRKQCAHEWIAKDINNPPKRCAKCKRLDWNRATKAIGRPKKEEPRPKAKPRGSRKGK